MAETLANWGTATSTGLVRRKNEDAVFARFPVFVVADGMGGQAAGEVAAAIASETFRSLGRGGLPGPGEVLAAIDLANQSVIESAQADESLAGMGTTLVGLAFVRGEDGPRWLAFNVGDSRLYRYFEGALAQVTRDHSEVQLLVDRGAISAEAARSHPHRNVITRAIGLDHSVEPDSWLLRPAAGERFLVCSDGLTGELDDAAIAAVLGSEPDPRTAATSLVEKAVASGGHDNISAIVVDLVAEPGSALGAGAGAGSTGSTGSTAGAGSTGSTGSDSAGTGGTGSTGSDSAGTGGTGAPPG